MTKAKDIEFDHVARVRTEHNGYVTERVLMPDGRTLERRSHPASGIRSNWRKTKAKFTAPADFLANHPKERGWTHEMTPEKRKNIQKKSRFILVFVCLLFACVTSYFFGKLIIAALELLAFLVAAALLGAFTKTPKPKTFMSWD
ncbi:MAG TPA: hypothetical protein VHM88_26635 [Candidatus Acidoferrales bacterium]|jgi:hypothetical protein|nr:hypothetical protein [Candidatus Acidoferrales bacterium]